MDQDKLTIKTQEVIQAAQLIAQEKQHQTIETGHILRALLNTDKDVTPFLFNALNVNSNILESALDKIIENYPKVTGGQMYMSNQMNKV